MVGGGRIPNQSRSKVESFGKETKMANICENWIKVSHDDPEMLKRFVEASQSDTIAQTFCPVSEINIHSFGCVADARMSLWGVRHDFGIEEYKCNKGKKISGWFRTKWVPPVGVYSALTKAGFRVKACWQELGEHFIGEYRSDSGIAEYNDTNKIPKHISKRFR